ncbi:MAG TPA: ferredoxin [Nocardioides sp.]|uniref:ferredoxin n=1 Tax=uncultured Nocardioides sp. TaxID=198441 RepID=UPI000ECAA0FE|nr:ferredoxin [uncultured Nocardioides sp.]HCB06221.1 ferredoxin [Nocardioides sp.]HRD59618.1 ferredoxin [Nocardioides sp.]HRI94239.1 ferredoxin [Nocardioides sp.]HRK44308.1 ferredoxin [Nocardioides sp.]
MTGSTLRADRERCIGSGLCTGLAPEVFGAADDDLVELLRQPERDRADVARAIASCPVEALGWSEAPTDEREDRG